MTSLNNSGNTLQIAKSMHQRCTHELKTPFMAIMGYADMLNEKAMSTLDEDQMQLAEKIKHAGTKALKSLEQFLALLHIQTVNTEDYCNEHFTSTRLTPHFIKSNIVSDLEKRVQRMITIGRLSEAEIGVPENYIRIILTELIRLLMQDEVHPGKITINGISRAKYYLLKLTSNPEMPNTITTFFRIITEQDAGEEYREGPAIGLTLAMQVLHRFGGTVQLKEKSKSAGFELVLKLLLNNSTNRND